MNRSCALQLPALMMLFVSAEGAIGQDQTIHGTSVSVDLVGVVTVLDNYACMLRQYSPDGKLIREIGGQGWGNDQFDQPAGLWARNGIDVFVADYGNHRICRFDNALAFVSSFSTRASANPDERFGYPTAITVSRLGDMFIADGENTRILKVGSNNRVALTFGGYNAGVGRLRRPIAIQCGPDDELVVFDPPRVMLYDSFGNFMSELAPGGFLRPTAIAADPSHIVVADSNGVAWFGRGNVLIGRSSLAGLQHPTSIALQGSTLFLLTPEGLRVIPGADQGLLDKEGKSQ